MKLTEFKVSNYKCFYESNLLDFSSGFNVVIGKNNVGKSALLEALTLKSRGKPHLSLLTLPKVTSPFSKISKIQFAISISGGELEELCLGSMNDIWVPIVPGVQIEEELTKLFGLNEIKFKLFMHAEDNGGFVWRLENSPTHGLFEVDDKNHYMMAVFKVSEDRKVAKLNGTGKQPWGTEFGYTVGNIFRDRIYNFKAERLVLADHGFGKNSVLDSDAGNLPEVLNILQGDFYKFKKFNELVNIIFPTIYQVSVRPKLNANNILEIVTWTENPELSRDDLVIPLSESGTGVGQVLAILYVVLSSKYPRTIIIDEPNSFLHPGAAKKLIEILRDKYSEHQYIISTHSPDILNSCNPNKLHFIKREEHQSVIETLDINDLVNIKSVFKELGVKLNDVFGADYIIWVEGETEEKCFKLILESIENKTYDSVNILSLIKTGDFSSKKIPANRFFEIYEKLSNGNALIPPAIAFEFDKEDRTEKEIEMFKQKAQNRAFILPRRMYENYLLDLDAIAHVLGELQSFNNVENLNEKVSGWFDKNGLSEKYFKNISSDRKLFDEEWYREVDGANILHDLFQDISEAKEMYSKMIHSYQLTEFLLENTHDSLQELKEFISSMLKNVHK